MHSEARHLLNDRTFDSEDWSLEELITTKRRRQLTIAVILPALNEELTVGGIVAQIRESLIDTCAKVHGEPLVDELVVLDSGSQDQTSNVAAEAGATVIHRDEVFPQLPAVLGKGEAMWRALGATTSDVVVFVDADLRSFTPSYVTGLVGPILSDESIHFVKAVYERPLVDGDKVIASGGGRVTELVARPLLNLYWPELAGIMQPLAGEYAARRSLLEQLPFHCGYGVDLALLIDTADLVGVRSIAQVDLGIRIHRHHDDRALGRMAAEIMQTTLKRRGTDATEILTSTVTGSRPDQPSRIKSSFIQFEDTADSHSVRTYDIQDVERPALGNFPAYRANHAMHSTSSVTHSSKTIDDDRID